MVFLCASLKRRPSEQQFSGCGADSSYLNSVQCQLYNCTLFRSQSFSLLASHVLLQGDPTQMSVYTAVLVKPQSVFKLDLTFVRCCVWMLLRYVSTTLSLDSWPNSLAALKIIWVPCDGETEGRVRRQRLMQPREQCRAGGEVSENRRHQMRRVKGGVEGTSFRNIMNRHSWQTGLIWGETEG